MRTTLFLLLSPVLALAAHPAAQQAMPSFGRARARDLAETHGPRHVRFLLTMTSDDHVAEDLRQDALQRAHAGDDAMNTVAEGRRSALSSIVRREDAVRLALAIDRLPILLREAFVLFVVEGLPYAEIAAATEVAEGTLQVRVHRAKALLRQQLGDQVDTWWLVR